MDETERVEETAEFFQLDDSVRDLFVLYPPPPCHLCMFPFLFLSVLPIIRLSAFIIIHHHLPPPSSPPISSFYVIYTHFLNTSTPLWHRLSRTLHIPMPIKVVADRRHRVRLPNVVVQRRILSMSLSQIMPERIRSH